MGGYRPADATSVVEHEDVLYAATLPSGPILVLDGISGLIWEVACEDSDAPVVDRVAELTGADPGDIRSEVERFVGDLVDRGLLVPRAG
ncbi:PqqD family protein [Agromyces binzhouensis]|uniref:PqqD family protein n=1 Tax=Agromyces binzhouensis TaxID=1817495 RepID=A0A4Q2JQ33_9MICO|nr:PqqD family protein [Agromyces binzhouensis]RXZ50142.1 PqqD family protein [Agromyces binzhouensis]